jgi:multidrug efflux pump
MAVVEPNQPGAADRDGRGQRDQPSRAGERPTGFFHYFLYSFRVTFLLIVGLGALGVWTVVTLPRESTPEVVIPVAAVVTVWPGASARDVEELVTTPVEDELSNLDGLENLTSSSRLGVSSVAVEFSADEDVDESLRRLREAVDRVNDLPADVEAPTVVEINFSDEPILSVSLGGIEDKRLLSISAEALADKLESIAGVSGVDVAGAQNEEIRIEVDSQRLSEQGVSIGQLLGAIRAANINAPFGQLETDKFAYDLRLLGGFANVGDVAAIPVVTAGGSVVPLDTLADVELTLSEAAGSSRVSVNRQESTPAVALSVRKKTGGNIVAIVKQVKQTVEAARGSSLPEGVQVAYFADRAEEIRTSLRNVTRSGIQTLFIVFGLLWLFLGWRAALVTSLAVPLTFSISFLVFDQTNTTLNGISLFSLILSLGLLVDTAIVVVEGIHHPSSRETGPGGGGGTRAEVLTRRAAEVIDRFKKPLAGGVLTTVAAFFPMLLVTGIIGQFLKVIPIVVSATLISSLFVALAFIPPVAVRLLLTRHGAGAERWFDRVFARTRTRYDVLIAWMLSSRRFQRFFIGALVLLLAAGLSLPFSGLLKTGLFPAVDIDFMLVNVELPPGSRLAETERVNTRIETVLQTVPEIDSYVANAGSGISLDFGGGSGSGEPLGSFYINLNKERRRSSLDVTAEVRDKLREISGATITIEDISAGPPTAPPVELRVIGNDVAELDHLSGEIMTELAAINGTTNVDRSLRYSAGEFNFTFDREALAEHGLTAVEVAQLLRTNVFGLEATTFLDGRGEAVSVRLEALDETVNSVDDVLVLPLRPAVQPGQAPLTLGEVATVNLSSSVDAIRHRDGERAVTVTAQAEPGANPNEITQELMRHIEERGLPSGYRVDFGGEQEETVETFNQLYRSMVIAVILILLILVVEFNSYRQPLIIFLSIPLALIGVLFGLLITGGQLNFAAFIGLVSLTGIVVNNAIILVDRMNSMRADGLTIEQAVKEASSSRLRPILLTTMTTAAGVAPLIWVDEFFRDMALTLITGLLFSSVITLVLIPILYLRQQQKIERKKLRQAAA